MVNYTKEVHDKISAYLTYIIGNDFVHCKERKKSHLQFLKSLTLLIDQFARIKYQTIAPSVRKRGIYMASSRTRNLKPFGITFIFL